MEICWLKRCVFVLSAILVLWINSIQAKPFSLNRAIAEELALKNSKLNTTSVNDIVIKANTTEKLVVKPVNKANLLKKGTAKQKPRYKLDESLRTFRKKSKSKPFFRKPEATTRRARNPSKLSDILHKQEKKLSPLKYRKLYQIGVPLKPKLQAPKIRAKRRNQLVKRESLRNDKLQHKYVPLLRSLSLLVDNILENDLYISESRDKPVSVKNDAKFPCRADTDKASDEEAAATSTASSTIPDETTTQTTAETTDHPTHGDERSLRQDPDIPLLPSRNTTRSRRNYPGVGERSSAARHWSTQGHFTRNNGDREHNSGERHGTSPKDNEENPNSITRNGARSDRPHRRDLDRDSRRGGSGDRTKEEGIQNTSHTSTEIGRDIEKSQVEDKLEAHGISEELAKSNRTELRGPVFENQSGDIKEPIQPQEVRADSFNHVTLNIADDQRFTYRNGPHSRENKKLGKENEAVISISRSDPDILQNIRNNKSVVVIIDGYSVTRDKNGENRLSEKSIHVHS